MEKEKRKAGLQPDGSWLLIDEDPPYKMPERKADDQNDNQDDEEERDVKEDSK